MLATCDSINKGVAESVMYRFEVVGVSSAYLRLLIFTPPICTSFVSSISLNIFSVYRLNKFGYSTPRYTAFFSLNSDVIPLSVLTDAVCSQCSLLIICKSSSIPISDKHSIILKCLT